MSEASVLVSPLPTFGGKACGLSARMLIGAWACTDGMQSTSVIPRKCKMRKALNSLRSRTCALQHKLLGKPDKLTLTES
jgi:hypothetical protein